ncbi:MAG: HEAT repeat domain-containing protein [Anaerolineales bacterium]|nr:HEAT repeat domain-containing protein [Anaerolineales bacterium]
MTFNAKNVFDRLNNGDEAQKEEAALELINAADSDAGTIISELGAVLENGDEDARWWAARALAGIYHPQAARLLLAALSDPDEDIRVCAIMGLGEHKGGGAVDQLLNLMRESSEYVARHIGDALSKIGEEAAPGLIAALEDERIIVRVQAARSLVRIESQQAIPALIKALDDPEPIVEHYAWEALQRMGVGVTVFFRP